VHAQICVHGAAALHESVVDAVDGSSAENARNAHKIRVSEIFSPYFPRIVRPDYLGRYGVMWAVEILKFALDRPGGHL